MQDSATLRSCRAWALALAALAVQIAALALGLERPFGLLVEVLMVHAKQVRGRILLLLGPPAFGSSYVLPAQSRA